MGTVAILLVALVVGWLGTLSLVRDISRVELSDFSFAAAGALLAGLILPRLGLEFLGESGLRLPTLFGMATTSVLTLIAANLARGRGIRTGELLKSAHREASK
jgi:hypothetical protein